MKPIDKKQILREEYMARINRVIDDIERNRQDDHSGRSVCRGPVRNFHA